jgi:mycothiol synthase
MPEPDDLPPLPEGFSARGATWEDAQAVTDLVREVNIREIGIPEIDLSEIQSDWRRPSMVIALDEHLILDPDGRLVAWAELYHAQDAQAAIFPEARGRGIGLHVIRWTEQRAIERAPEGATATRVRQGVNDRNEAGHRLFLACGYEPVWNSWIFEIPLDGEIPTASAPEGITIRRFESGRDERATHQVVDEAFSEWESHSPEPFQDWEVYTLSRDGVDTSLWFLAEAEDAIVGAAVVSFFPEDGDGWIDELAVAQAHRRRGVGKALATNAFAGLKERGARKAMLSTDSRGGGRHLYESAGMHVTRSYTKFEKQLHMG